MCQDRHRCLVVPLDEQRHPVRRPPEPPRAAQLLPRDELGEPPAHLERIALVRPHQEPVGPGLVDDVQRAVAGIADRASRRVEPGVDNGRGDLDLPGRSRSGQIRDEQP